MRTPTTSVLAVPSAERMDLSPTPEETAFRQAMHAYLEALGPPAAAEPVPWSKMATDLDLHLLCLPESVGGVSAGMQIGCAVAEELGAACSGAPFIMSAGTVAPMLAELSGPAASAVLDDVVGSACTVTLVLPQPDGPTPSTPPPTVIAGADGRLTGEVAFVLDAAMADVLLVPARGDGTDELSLYVVRPTEPGVSIATLATLDPVRGQADVSFEQARGELVGRGPDVGAMLECGFDRVATLLAADQLGLAQWCLDSCVAYAGQRMQFGRVLGSFQSIKHMCADLLVEVEAARSAVRYAAWVADNEPGQLAVAASVAKSIADDAARVAAAACVQIHGALGYSWEHGAHMRYRRAHSSAVLFGDTTFHRYRIAAALGMS